ncbi:MAG: Ppx/GppA phosphatase family protein [Deltaproteobacteria bacterium]|nr:Ppx/GppA phosphatase family protein [Deltaproteobacteria bacterium]
MRLRIVEANEPTQRQEIHSERAAVRLGREVFLSGKLAAGALADAVDALKRFRESMRLHNVEVYRAVATSAVRDASNGDVLVERAEREASIKLEVIEGVEEARLARVAVRHALDLGQRRALLIDIGGGSVELTMMAGEIARQSVSLPLGTVRLSEAFLERDVAVSAERATLLTENIERLLTEARWLKKAKVEIAIATGGNAEAIATLAPAQTPLGPGINVDVMRALRTMLSAISVKERRERYDLRGDRADVIIPAAYVLTAVADAVGVRQIVTPPVGLKDGILVELIERAFRVWDEQGEAAAVEAEAIALGQRYRFDEGHARLVADLSASLFDQLQPIHGLGPAERSQLRLAAILHDVGDFVGYEAHHKHTYYLVSNCELMGLSPESKEIVANVARYHRKALPDLSHLGFRKLDRRGRTVVRKLAALLRIADSFDREHLGKVHRVDALISPTAVRFLSHGEGDLALERWTALRKADLFEEIAERPVIVEGAEAMGRVPRSL